MIPIFMVPITSPEEMPEFPQPQWAYRYILKWVMPVAYKELIKEV